MRIDPAKLDYFASLCKKDTSYDSLMGRIIEYLQRHPDFEKELLA
jgi:hypothetical protein